MKIINDIMATRLLFFIMAFFVGLWTIRIPTIKDQINTDYFGIGLVMATFAIGSIIAMVFANNIIKMSSARTVLLYTSILQALLWLPTPFIPSLLIFMIFSFIFGLCYGSFEISCNLYASNLEKREKKSMMSGFHAFWSLGVLIGSITTSLFLEWNISFLNSGIEIVSAMIGLFCIPVILDLTSMKGKHLGENETPKSLRLKESFLIMFTKKLCTFSFLLSTPDLAIVSIAGMISV